MQRLPKKRRSAEPAGLGRLRRSLFRKKRSRNAITVSQSVLYGLERRACRQVARGSAANYDVISPSSDVAASIARTGLAAPLDLSKLPSYSQLLRNCAICRLSMDEIAVTFFLIAAITPCL